MLYETVLHTPESGGASADPDPSGTGGHAVTSKARARFISRECMRGDEEILSGSSFGSQPTGCHPAPAAMAS